MAQTPCRFTTASLKTPRLLESTTHLNKKELAQEQ